MPDPERGEAVLLATLSVREADILASLLAHHLINICTGSMAMVLLLVRISCRQQNYRSRGRFFAPKALLPRYTSMNAEYDCRFRSHAGNSVLSSWMCRDTKRAQRSIQFDLPPNCQKTHRLKPSVRRRTANEHRGRLVLHACLQNGKHHPQLKEVTCISTPNMFLQQNMQFQWMIVTFICLYFLNFVFFSN